MSKRREFPKSIKLKRFDYAQGRCEECFQRIVGTAQYDHAVPDALGGSNDFENCRCMCVRCHRMKTDKTDVPRIAKAVRIVEKRAGLRKSGRGFQKPPPGYDSFNRRWRDER